MGLLGWVARFPGLVELDAALAAAGIVPIASTAATHTNSLTNPLGITAGSKSSRASQRCNYAAAPNRRAGLRAAIGSVIAPTTASAATISPRISPAFQWSWLTPSASELLIE